MPLLTALGKKISFFDKTENAEYRNQHKDEANHEHNETLFRKKLRKEKILSRDECGKEQYESNKAFHKKTGGCSSQPPEVV
jgi:hypothetical protein